MIKSVQVDASKLVQFFYNKIPTLFFSESLDHFIFFEFYETLN